MQEIFNTARQVLEEEVNQRLRQRDQRRQCVEVIMHWLAHQARKKPVPDLEARMTRLRRRLEHLVENMELKLQADGWVVKVAGSDLDTYRQLQYGTSWFDGDPELAQRLIFGVFADQSVVNAE